MRKGDQPFTQNTPKATSVSKRYFYSAACSHSAHTPALRVKRLDRQKKGKQREEFSGNKLEEFALWQNSSSFWLSLINLYGIEPACTEGLTQRGMIFMCVWGLVLYLWVCVCAHIHYFRFREEKKKSSNPPVPTVPDFGCFRLIALQHTATPMCLLMGVRKIETDSTQYANTLGENLVFLNKAQLVYMDLLSLEKLT